MNKQHLFFIFALMIFVLPGCELIDDDSNGELRDKFTGTWRFNEDDTKSSLAYYTVLITIDPTNSTQVLLKNFGNLGNFYQATGIVTTNRISIETQSIASVTINGSGTLSSNTQMNWSYTINDGADQVTYTAVAEKQ